MSPEAPRELSIAGAAPLRPPVDALRSAIATLWEWLLRLDEPLVARALLDHVPYVLEGDAAIAEMRTVAEGVVAHLASPAECARWHADIWEAAPPTTRDEICAMAQCTPRFQWAQQEAETRGARSVLDLGSGNGALPLYLALHGIRAHGVNLTARAVDAATRVAADLGLPATFSCEAAETVERAERADLVCAFEILEHVREPAALIAAMHRNAAPGGRCLLTTPHGSTTYGLDTWDMIRRNGGRIGEPMSHVRVYTVPRLLALLGETAEIALHENGVAAGELWARWGVPS